MFGQQKTSASLLRAAMGGGGSGSRGSGSVAGDEASNMTNPLSSPTALANQRLGNRMGQLSPTSDSASSAGGGRSVATSSTSPKHVVGGSKSGRHRSPTSSEASFPSSTRSRRSSSVIRSQEHVELFEHMSSANTIKVRKNKDKVSQILSPVDDVFGVAMRSMQTSPSIEGAIAWMKSCSTQGEGDADADEEVSVSIRQSTFDESIDASSKSALDLKNNDNAFHVMAHLLVDFFKPKLVPGERVLLLETKDRDALERILPATVRLEFIEAVQYRLERTPASPSTPLQRVTLQCQELSLDRQDLANPVVAVMMMKSEPIHLPVLATSNHMTGLEVTDKSPSGEMDVVDDAEEEGDTNDVEREEYEIEKENNYADVGETNHVDDDEVEDYVIANQNDDGHYDYVMENEVNDEDDDYVYGDEGDPTQVDKHGQPNQHEQVEISDDESESRDLSASQMGYHNNNENDDPLQSTYNRIDDEGETTLVTRDEDPQMSRMADYVEAWRADDPSVLSSRYSDDDDDDQWEVADNKQPIQDDHDFTDDKDDEYEYHKAEFPDKVMNFADDDDAGDDDNDGSHDVREREKHSDEDWSDEGMVLEDNEHDDNNGDDERETDEYTHDEGMAFVDKEHDENDGDDERETEEYAKEDWPDERVQFADEEHDDSDDDDDAREADEEISEPDDDEDTNAERIELHQMRPMDPPTAYEIDDAEDSDHVSVLKHTATMDLTNIEDHDDDDQDDFPNTEDQDVDEAADMMDHYADSEQSKTTPVVEDNDNTTQERSFGYQDGMSRDDDDDDAVRQLRNEEDPNDVAGQTRGARPEEQEEDRADEKPVLIDLVDVGDGSTSDPSTANEAAPPNAKEGKDVLQDDAEDRSAEANVGVSSIDDASKNQEKTDSSTAIDNQSNRADKLSPVSEEDDTDSGDPLETFRAENISAAPSYATETDEIQAATQQAAQQSATVKHHTTLTTGIATTNQPQISQTPAVSSQEVRSGVHQSGNDSRSLDKLLVANVEALDSATSDRQKIVSSSSKASVSSDRQKVPPAPSKGSSNVSLVDSTTGEGLPPTGSVKSEPADTRRPSNQLFATKSDVSRPTNTSAAVPSRFSYSMNSQTLFSGRWYGFGSSTTTSPTVPEVSQPSSGFTQQSHEKLIQDSPPVNVQSTPQHSGETPESKSSGAAVDPYYTRARTTERAPEFNDGSINEVQLVNPAQLSQQAPAADATDRLLSSETATTEHPLAYVQAPEIEIATSNPAPVDTAAVDSVSTSTGSLARQQLLAELREASNLMAESVNPETAKFWRDHVLDLQARLRAMHGDASVGASDNNSEMTKQTSADILERNRRLLSEFQNREAYVPPSPSTVEANRVSVVNSEPNRTAKMSRQEPYVPENDIPIVDVVAPADLPGGYHFEAEIEGQRFLATVPPGGVQQGETFTCYMRELDSVAIDIPVGYWKDGIHNVFKYGCCHPVIWNSLFVPLVSLSQIQSRVNLDFLGRPKIGDSGLSNRFVVLTVMVCWLLINVGLFLGYNLKFMNGIPLSVADIIAFGLVNVVMFGFIVFVTQSTRSSLREKFLIREQRCYDLEDICCATFCMPCTICQMARHTANFDDYEAVCCSHTGLPDGVRVNQAPMKEGANYLV